MIFLLIYPDHPILIIKNSTVSFGLPISAAVAVYVVVAHRAVAARLGAAAACETHSCVLHPQGRSIGLGR